MLRHITEPKDRSPLHSFPYILYLPDGYEEEDREWPLVIFLHGAGERGTDLNVVYCNGLANRLKNGDAFPFIAVMPQCPENRYWNGLVESLDAFLDDILAEYRVDKSRVYLTGLSMGGQGTWSWSMYAPERFAAIVPVCGIGVPWNAGQLVHTPVWAFHGDKDDVIHVEESIWMVDSINGCGGNARLTIYEGVGHDSWVPAYNDPELYEWLLSQKLTR